MDKFQITVDGKLYGYWLDQNGAFGDIRSESNPYKTPYLKVGSKTYNKVATEIKKELSK